METMSFSNVFKKILALILVAYFSIFSPVVALAVVTQPVSAPISIPVPVPDPTPTPTLAPITVRTDSVVVTLDRANAQGGLVYGPGFTIKSNGAEAWQIRNSVPTQGQGFYESSGGIGVGGTANIRTYINTNKPNGTYVGLATVDYYQNGKWQTGPSVKYTITLIGAQPDLTIDLKAVVDSVGIGTTANIGIGTSAGLAKKVTLTAIVKNIGSSSAQSSVTRIINTTNSNEYWRLATNSLNPGGSQALTITTFKNPGTYYFIAETDADSQVNESKEDNNLFQISVTVPELKPDLVIEKVNILGKHQVGAKDEIEITVKNAGNLDINSKVGTGVFVYDPKGRKVEDFLANMEEIKASSSNTRRFSLNNNYQATGSYKVVITADYFNYISESNEQNNSYTTSVNVSQAAVINQPIISYIWPYRLRVGRYIVLWGSDFGASGKINFYQGNQTAASGSVTIYYWSNTLIYGRVPNYIKGNQQYGIQVTTSDGRNNSLTYRYINR